MRRGEERLTKRAAEEDDIESEAVQYAAARGADREDVACAQSRPVSLLTTEHSCAQEPMGYQATLPGWQASKLPG